MKDKVSTEVINFIFKSPDKTYLAFTNSSGIATATGVKTEKPPIQNRILISPARVKARSWIGRKIRLW